MLKKLRNKKTAKKIWIILAVLIVPAFVLWGAGSFTRDKKESTYIIGKIFGKKISALEYKDALDAVKNMAVMQYGDKFSEIQKYVNFESQAWERLVLLAEAKKQKIKVSDEEIKGVIRSYPFFQRKNQFDNSIYLEVLRYIFHTQPRAFEEQIRQNIMLSKLYNVITSSVTLADEEIKEAYRKENEQVSINYIAALYADFEKDLRPSDEEIKNYFVNNSLQFKQPLSFNLQYATLPLEDNDAQSQEEKINRLTAWLNKNEDISKVALEFGLTVKETGLFEGAGPIPGIGWSQEILNLISKAQTGQYLPLAHIDKNYYILRLKERKEPYIPEFETITDKAKEAFIKDKSQGIAKEKIEICLKKLKDLYQNDPKKIDWDKASKECGLKSNSTDLFKYGSYIEGIGASDNFWLAAEKLKEKEFSEIINMPSGFYIIKLKSRSPVEEEKFAKESPEFSQKLLSQKRQEYFYKFLGDLRKRAQTSY